LHTLKVEHWWAKKSDELHLYFMGDIHAGARACDVDRLDADIDRIRHDREARVILMGDLADCIKRSDKRFDPEAMWPWLLERSDIAAAQVDWLLERLSPIKGKIMCAVSGNHEDHIRMDWEQDIHDRIRVGLGVPSMGYYGIVRVSARRKDNPNDTYAIDIAVHHGFGGGTTAGGVLTTLERMLAVYDCDIAAMGHRHKRLHLCLQTIRYCANRQDPRIDARTRIGLCAGTYLATFAPGTDTYSGKKGYQPSPTGCAMVRVRLPDCEMRVEDV
jgi:hypothetical protein